MGPLAMCRWRWSAIGGASSGDVWAEIKSKRASESRSPNLGRAGGTIPCASGVSMVVYRGIGVETGLIVSSGATVRGAEESSVGWTVEFVDVLNPKSEAGLKLEPSPTGENGISKNWLISSKFERLYSKGLLVLSSQTDRKGGRILPKIALRHHSRNRSPQFCDIRFQRRDLIE